MAPSPKSGKGMPFPPKSEPGSDLKEPSGLGAPPSEAVSRKLTLFATCADDEGSTTSSSDHNTASGLRSPGGRKILMRSVISMKPLSLTRLRPPDELKPILKPPTDFYELERIPVSSRKGHGRRVKFKVKKKRADGELQASLCGMEFQLLAPGSKKARRWGIIMVIPLTYESLAIPFRLAISSPGANVQLFMDLAFDVWSVVDVAVTLLTAVKTKSGFFLTSTSEIRRHYLKTGFLWEELPATALYLANAIVSLGAAPVWLWWTASLMRIGRTVRLLNFFREMAHNLDVDDTRLQAAKFVIFLTLAIHWIGCIFYFLSRIMGFGENTWPARMSMEAIPAFDPLSSGMAAKYLIALYKGINALTNLGYEGVRPVNAVEMVLSISVMFVQIFVMAYILGTLFHHLVAKDEALEENKKKFALMNEFCKHRNLPEPLRLRLLRLMDFHYSKVRQYYGASKIHLPPALVMRVMSSQFKSVVDTCVLRGGPLHGCNPQFLNRILLNLSEVYLMPGEEFIKQGDVSRKLGFLSSGTIEVRDEDKGAGHLVYGDTRTMPTIIGHIGFFLCTTNPLAYVNSKTAEAKVLQLDHVQYESIIASYPEQHDIILTNLLETYGLDKSGKTLPSWTSDEDGDGIESKVREIILAAVTKQRQDMESQLLYAVTNADLEKIKTLIRKGVDIETSTYDKSSMLHLASRSGNVPVMRTLLKEGADKNRIDRWGKTPLHWAGVSGNQQAMDILLECGALLSVNDPATDLCTSAMRDDVMQLRRLIDNGASPASTDYDMRTALHIAAACGNVKSTEYLLSKGMDPNLTDRWMGVPMMDAIMGGHVPVAMILRKAGGRFADPGAAGTQLCEAAMDGNVRQLKLLVDCGVGLNQATYDCRTALHLAAIHGKLLAVSFLLSISADPTRKDRWGFTPLDYAIRGNHLLCAKLLRGQGGELGDNRSTQAATGLRTLDAQHTFAAVREAISEMQRKGLGEKVNKAFSSTDIQHRHYTILGSLKAVAELQQTYLKVPELLERQSCALQSALEMLWSNIQAHHIAAQAPMDDDELQQQEDEHINASFVRLQAVMNQEIKTMLRRRHTFELHEAADVARRVSLDGDQDTFALEGCSWTDKQAQIFQRMVVRNLSDLQAGFDILDNEVNKLGRLETVGLLEPSNHRVDKKDLNTLLLTFGARPSERDISQILQEQADMEEYNLPGGGSVEALHSQEAPVPANSVELRFLWADAPTFWSLLQKAEKSTSFIVAHRSDQSSAAGCPGMIAPNQNEGASQMRKDLLRAHSLAENTFMDLCTPGTQHIDTSAFKKVASKLGEFGAPVFDAMFHAGGGGDTSQLCRSEFMLCVMRYLSSSGSDIIQSSTSGAMKEDKQDKRSKVRSKWWLGIVKQLRPLQDKTLLRKISSPEAVKESKAAFIQTTGDIASSLGKQNVRHYLQILFPDAKVLYRHVDVFMAAIDRDKDTVITWEELCNVHTRNHDDGDFPERSIYSVIPSLWERYFKDGVLLPDTIVTRTWDFLRLALSMFNFIVVPLQIASFELQTSEAVEAINWIVDGFFIADILLNFVRAYYRDSVLVTDMRDIYQHYIAGQFLFDAVAALPLPTIAINASPQTKAWLRLPKMIRVRTVYVYFKGQVLSMEGSLLIKSLARLLVLTVMIAHLCACMFLYIGQGPGEQWMQRVALSGYYPGRPDDNVWDKYLLALYYVMSTFTTNGLVEELNPSTYVEAGFATLLMLLNMTMFAYIIGEISSLIMEGDNELAKARKKQAAVENYIKAKDVSDKALALDIRSHAKARRSKGQSAGIDQIYMMVRHPVRVEIAKHICRDALENVSLFSKCCPEFLDSLSVIIRERSFAADEYIFHANEEASEMFYIRSGDVLRLFEIPGEEPILDGKSTKGQCVGELSFFFRMRHLYSATACQTVETFTMNHRHFAQMLKMHPLEEDTVAQNALKGYDEVVSKAPSVATNSKLSVRSIGSALDNIIGLSVQRTISALKKQRSAETVDKAIRSAADGDLVALKEYMPAKVSVNSKNHDGRTCLHLAACNGHIHVMEYLLDEMGADTSVMDMYGNSPLNDAVRHQQDDAAALLRTRGSTLKLNAMDVGVALCEAAFANDMGALMRLVENGIDPGTSDYDGRTAAHLAASEGRTEILKYLISKGANPNPRDRFGGTPLDDAIRHRQWEAQLVLRNGGGCMSRQAEAMCQASARGDIEAIRTYLANGANPNEGDADGRTALHLAACENRLGVIEFLLSYHTMPEYEGMDPVDVNAVDCMGQTPLDDAIRHGNSLVAGLLADSGGIDSDSQGIQQVRERHAEAKKQRERAAAKAAAVDHVWGTPEDLDRAKAANFLGRLEAFSQIPQELCGIADGLLRGFEEAKAANQHNRARKQSKRGQASLGPSGDVLFEALESVAFRLSEWQSLLATSELQRSSRVPSIAVSPIEILNDISMHQMAVSNTLQKTSQVIEHIIDRLLELRNAHITGPETTASPSAVKRQGKADFDL